jgi:hypothetical protein
MSDFTITLEFKGPTIQTTSTGHSATGRPYSWTEALNSTPDPFFESRTPHADPIATATRAVEMKTGLPKSTAGHRERFDAVLKSMVPRKPAPKKK